MLRLFDALLRSTLAAAVGAYRMTLSPLMLAMFGPACRFQPSCSEYAADAIRDHGPLRGGYLAMRRLLRCRPMGGHGYDPVPPVFERAVAPAHPAKGEPWKPAF